MGISENELLQETTIINWVLNIIVVLDIRYNIVFRFIYYIVLDIT